MMSAAKVSPSRRKVSVPKRSALTPAERQLSVGIVLRRSFRLLDMEPFYGEFIAGMEDVLAEHEGSVVLQVVPSLEKELESYQRWVAYGQVAGVVVGNLVEGDQRVDFLRKLGVPTLVLGEPEVRPDVAGVRSDNFGAMASAVAHLTDLGHVNIGRVSGPHELLHTRDRTQAFEATIDKLGARGRLVEGDYSEDGGERATRTLLGLADPPTAIIYDNDVMAIAGLGVAYELGLDVPGALSILAWDDSTLCRLAVPPLSVMSRDVYQLGESAAESLIKLIAGEAPTVVQAPTPSYLGRGSTARAPKPAPAPA
jgi:DNA-binding LacI/PurR family transcriptional regulator